jgi:CubicO group peptidase (beta-lactamase class C family)
VTSGEPGRLLAAAAVHAQAHEPRLRSLLVVQHRQRLLETYFGGIERDYRFDHRRTPPYLTDEYATAQSSDQAQCVKSVTKSVLSLLVGAALADGSLRSLDQSLGELLAAEIAARPDLAGITIGNLLAMRSGLEWEENGDITWRWFEAPDQIAFTVAQQRLVHPPGARWVYSTSDSHLAGACLARAVGMPLLDYAHQVFRPLRFSNCRWTADAAGRNIGGSELFLRPRDMAKIGLLCLAGGCWEGVSVVPAEWLAMATRPQPELTGPTALLMQPGATPSPYRTGFGLGFWVGDFGGVRTVFARGHGGQGIFTFPTLDAVVVTTANWHLEDDPDDPDPEMRFITDHVLPALRDRPPE